MWNSKRRAFVLALALGVFALALSATVAKAQDAPVLPPEAHPHGHTYGDWAAAWWQWALAQPADTNPVLDQTGANCSVGQEGKVWFLAGSFDSGPVNRACAVPTGTALLIPVVNYVYCAFVSDPPEQRTEEFVRSQVSFVPDLATGLTASVDGMRVTDIQARYFEESSLFSVVLPDDNIFGLPGGFVLDPCVDAGYYVVVRPLPPGEHVIHFGGSLGDFGLDVTYQITVAS
jgi:hypothetical protein